MDEPALSFEGIKLSPQKELVRVFYKEMWDRADKTLIPTHLPSRFQLPRLAWADARRA